MIVLSVIGVLTAILLPVARMSMPDESLIKFGKAHNTLGTVIRELVNGDKYYSEGDLGKNRRELFWLIVLMKIGLISAAHFLMLQMLN